MTNDKLSSGVMSSPSFIFKLVPHAEAVSLIPILRDADEDETTMRRVLADASTATYAISLCSNKDGMAAALIAALTVRWDPAESELIYLSVDATCRGSGYGRRIMLDLLDLARARTRSLVVGTGNSSIGNLAFYQKCGFRMDSVRKDYFVYVQPPVFEDGILLRDMVMLRYDF